MHVVPLQELRAGHAELLRETQRFLPRHQPGDDVILHGVPRSASGGAVRLPRGPRFRHGGQEVCGHHQRRFVSRNPRRVSLTMRPSPVERLGWGVIVR